MDSKISTLFTGKSLKIIFLFFSLMLLSVYFLVDPSKNLYFYKCPLKLITGFECAGCGTQRALHELLHFRFLDAFKHNPLFVASTPFFLLITTNYFFDNKFVKYFLNNYMYSKKLIVIMIIVILIFSVLKNTYTYKDYIANL